MAGTGEMWAPWRSGARGSAYLSISSVTLLQCYKMLETLTERGFPP